MLDDGEGSLRLKLHPNLVQLKMVLNNSSAAIESYIEYVFHPFLYK
jgi:hypothetical protein